MAIVKFKPTERIQKEPNLPRIAPKEYENIARDDKVVPVDSLIKYISGSPWTVDYYSQLSSKHNDLREIDPGEHPVYQQYTKVNRYILNVTNGLSTSFDQETNITKVTGSSTMFSFIIPNVNDYFTSDAGSSRTGLFKITSIDRKSFNAESVYDITYDLIGYTDTGFSEELFTNLAGKVVKEYWFDDKRYSNGLYPLVLEEQNQFIVDYNIVYRDLAVRYFDTFFSRKWMTLVLPGQEVAIYDPYVALYLTKIVESEIIPQYREFRLYNTEKDPYLKQDQFWSIMLSRAYSCIENSNKKMGLLSKSQFCDSIYLHGFRYSTMQYMLYPVDPDTGAMVGSYPSLKYPDSDFGVTRVISPVTLYEGRELLPAVDDYYVLSEAFYTDREDMSVMEVLAKDYIKQQSIDRGMLSFAVESYKRMSKLDQFYYGPILITIVKDVVKNTHL